jgi:SRSO17 transposase
MDLKGTEDSASRFAAYVGELTSVIGHADRVKPLSDYCSGLLVTEGRRSVEPIAAVTEPAEASAQHQRLLHFVSNAPWPDEPVLAKVRELVLPAIQRHGPIEVWIIDDTSFPKCGSKSVGVHHQYCGQLGKQANCQVAVTLSIANHHASLPIAYRLYLPEKWAKNPSRRKKAHVPKAIRFKTKPQIALQQIRQACAVSVTRGVVLMDASYGANSALRSGISALGLTYVAAIIPTVKVRKASNRGASEERLSAKELSLSPAETWLAHDHLARGNERQAALALCPRAGAHCPDQGAAARPEETLLIEWPEGEAEPTKYWLATVDENISISALVDLAKMRWRVERDYLELKQEIGLGHYEGRGWPGFHHHGTLCIAVYGFLISEQETIPPSGPHCARRLKKPAIPDSYRPRGASNSAPTSRSQLDRHAPSSLDRRDRKNAAKMPMLHKQIQNEDASCFVTQYD